MDSVELKERYVHTSPRVQSVFEVVYVTDVNDAVDSFRFVKLENVEDKNLTWCGFIPEFRQNFIAA